MPIVMMRAFKRPPISLCLSNAARGYIDVFALIFSTDRESIFTRGVFATYGLWLTILVVSNYSLISDARIMIKYIYKYFI